MSWPTPQDYNEAIQNPAYAFSDRELAGGHPELTPLGLPRPITGNFASVYHMRTAGRQWAVRCFWREYADMSDRYAAISAHLHAARLPYTVGFEYQPQGILIRGTRYPLLKMEWVDGELLNDYVERNLGNRSALSDLAGRWTDMVSALEGVRIAHGDLQHGNVIVVKGELKLVDYDCMYVPALAGRVSHELGHQNYQHPRRAAADFGPSTDRFSAWVIYLSLLALSKDPDLWKQLSAGDECLLLRSADLVAPETSAAFRALLGHRDARVRTVAQHLATFLRADPDRLLPLDTAFEIMRSAPIAESSAVFGPLRPIWRSPARQRRGAPAVESAPPRAATSPSWLADYVDVTGPQGRTFSPPSTALRALLAGGLLLVLVCTAAVVTIPSLLPIGAAAWLGAGAVSSVTILSGFYRDDAARSLRRLRCRERRQVRAVRAVERLLERRRREREGLFRRLDTARERSSRLEQELHRQESAEQALARDIRDKAVQTWTARLRCIEADEAAALDAALRGRQEAHVRSFLRDRSLRTAALSSIPWTSRARLWASGVRTAGDLTASRMRTIQWLGERALLELAGWRVDAEREARRSAPAALASADHSSVSAPFARARGKAQAKCDAAVETETRLVAALEQRYGRRYSALAAERHRAEDALAKGIAEVESGIAAVEARHREEIRRLALIREDLEHYRGISLARYGVHVLASWWR